LFSAAVAAVSHVLSFLVLCALVLFWLGLLDPVWPVFVACGSSFAWFPFWPVPRSFGG
jgi:hypothetical protein